MIEIAETFSLNFKIFSHVPEGKQAPDFIIFARNSDFSNNFDQRNDANEPKTLTLHIWKLCRKN